MIKYIGMYTLVAIAASTTVNLSHVRKTNVTVSFICTDSDKRGGNWFLALLKPTSARLKESLVSLIINYYHKTRRKVISELQIKAGRMAKNQKI